MSVEAVKLDQKHYEYLEGISTEIGLSIPATLHVVVQFIGRLHSEVDGVSKQCAIAAMQNGNITQLRHLDFSRNFHYESNDDDPALVYDAGALLHASSYKILRKLAEDWRLTIEQAALRCIWLCLDIISMGFEGRRVVFLNGDPSQNRDEDLLGALLPKQPELANTHVLTQLGLNAYSIENQADIDDLIIAVSGIGLEDDRKLAILNLMMRAELQELKLAYEWLRNFRNDDEEPSSMDFGKRRIA